jgi:hypothetical protein
LAAAVSVAAGWAVGGVLLFAIFDALSGLRADERRTICIGFAVATTVFAALFAVLLAGSD